jgi:hypothetical protein
VNTVGLFYILRATFAFSVFCVVVDNKETRRKKLISETSEPQYFVFARKKKLMKKFIYERKKVTVIYEFPLIYVSVQFVFARILAQPPQEKKKQKQIIHFRGR